MKPEEFAAWWVIVRDMVFVGAGIAWLTIDVLSKGPERWWLRFIAGGVAVLPVFTRRDEKKRPELPEPAEPEVKEG